VCYGLCVVVRYSVLQCVAVCCSVLQCVAVCCSEYCHDRADFREMFSQRSPRHTQKSPIFSEKSSIHTQKSPMFSQKSPIHNHDRADFREIFSSCATRGSRGGQQKFSKVSSVVILYSQSSHGLTFWEILPAAQLAARGGASFVDLVRVIRLFCGKRCFIVGLFCGKRSLL